MSSHAAGAQEKNHMKGCNSKEVTAAHGGTCYTTLHNLNVYSDGINVKNQHISSGILQRSIP